MVSGADSRVFRRGDDPRWAPVFAARPDLDRLEVCTWVAEDAPVFDMFLHWSSRRRPVRYTALPRGPFQDVLLDCWEQVDPQAFTPVG